MPVLDRIQADVGRFGNSLFVVLGVLGVFIDFAEDLDVCSVARHVRGTRA
jgi:hypothetical protein